jgi:GNAT superfamily N-acetyltransferase
MRFPMNPAFVLDTIRAADHDEVARLLHRSLVHWYHSRLNQGDRFGDRPEPFRLIPEVYEALDPGQGIAARDASTGALLGVCFVHPRETHVAVGIVATSPEAAGQGVARAMMRVAIGRAEAAGLPLRLVSSLLNLDSFSLYTRMGLVPHQMFQDLVLDVPEGGMQVPPPEGTGRVRPARPDEAARLADFERDLQGVRRQRDFDFFLRNEVGDWKVRVMEDAGGRLEGFLVASHHPMCGMIGPGLAADEASGAALLWRALDARRGSRAVFLVPCAAAGLVRTLYGWGARNVELHAAQILGPVPSGRGWVFPTFLPETA